MFFQAVGNFVIEAASLQFVQNVSRFAFDTKAIRVIEHTIGDYVGYIYAGLLRDLVFVSGYFGENRLVYPLLRLRLHALASLEIQAAKHVH